MPSGDVTHIEIRSAVNESLEPFCTIVVNGGDMLGQLPPDEVRDMALGWLGAAEAAEQDAIVMALLMEDVGLDFDSAGGFVARMRERRA